MYERCAVNQWRGLSSSERAFIELAWENGRTPSHPTLSGYRIFSLWAVDGPITNTTDLLSIKIDGPHPLGTPT